MTYSNFLVFLAGQAQFPEAHLARDEDPARASCARVRRGHGHVRRELTQRDRQDPEPQSQDPGGEMPPSSGRTEHKNSKKTATWVDQDQADDSSSKDSHKLSRRSDQPKGAGESEGTESWAEEAGGGDEQAEAGEWEAGGTDEAHEGNRLMLIILFWFSGIMDCVCKC